MNFSKLLFFIASVIFKISPVYTQKITPSNLSNMTQVANFQELQNAINANEKQIQIKGSILCSNTILLAPGVALSGIAGQVSMLSFSSGDGVGITANNTIADLTILTATNQRAIYNTAIQPDLGIFRLNNLTITGQVSIIARNGVMATQVVADNIDIVACDARRWPEQPQKYNVNVLQGAMTIYNFSGDTKSLMKATLTNISIGRANAPVLGSGLFVGGFGDNGGFLEADLITTNDVYSTGMLTYGVADIITGGIFLLYGANAKQVINKGNITTYGTNDMVLDNWGTADIWVTEKPIRSYGPSGIGFVNFGTVNFFHAKDVIETYGEGARGFNQYDGTVKEAIFNAITTFGNGSIGIQVSKPVGTLRVENSIITNGSIGSTLLKGVIVQMPAYAFSIKPGGEVKNLVVGKNMITNGNNVATLEVEAPIEAIKVGEKIIANGNNSTAITISKGVTFNDKGLDTETKSGKTIIIQ